MSTAIKALKITLIALLCLTGLFLILGQTSSRIPWDHKLSDNEARAASTLRSIMAAQEVSLERHGKYLHSVQALVDANYLGQRAIDPKESGYIFTLKLLSPEIWEATAAPATPYVTGDKWFFTTNLDGQLRRKWYEPADSKSFSYETGEGESNGPSLLDRWFCREAPFYAFLLMAFRTGVVTFCVFVLYMFLKVLGVGQPDDEQD